MFLISKPAAFTFQPNPGHKIIKKGHTSDHNLFQENSLKSVKKIGTFTGAFATINDVFTSILRVGWQFIPI